MGIGVEGDATLDGQCPFGRVGARTDVDGEPEAVEQLRAQLTLLWVHRADEHEAAGVLVGDPLALHAVDTAGRDIQQQVDQVVRQQVDLVHVQHPAVAGAQQAGMEVTLAAAEGRPQVDGADEAVLGGADRQLDERSSVRQQGGEAAGERGLGAALVATHEHAADGGIDGIEQEGELGLVLADHGGQRKHRCHRPSSQPSASSSPARSVCRAWRDASHSPRSLASRSRSAIERRAQGLDCSKNFRTSGSPT